MKLNSINMPAQIGNSHWDIVLAGSRLHESGGRHNHQRVVQTNLHLRFYLAKNTAAIVADRRPLAMAFPRGRNRYAAIDLIDALHAKADTEDRHFSRGFAR
jgi:hypothetical protein